jgi:hypothetical protein
MAEFESKHFAVYRQRRTSCADQADLMLGRWVGVGMWGEMGGPGGRGGTRLHKSPTSSLHLGIP